MNKIKVGVLGGTGMVGRTFISLLENHPWFEVAYVAASERSAGRPYEEAVGERWHLTTPMPAGVKRIQVSPIDAIKEAVVSCSLIFSALDTEPAKEFEEQYAAAGLPVISNAAANRWGKDIPMVIPEVNPEHLNIIAAQQKARGWKRGFIAVKPNCSIQSYVAPLFALRAFGPQQAIVTTMQAISGGGHSSFATIDIEDNIIPFIKGEEEKSEREPLKLLGHIEGDEIVSAKEPLISAHCSRVPVFDGHMATVSVKFHKKPSKEEMLAAWATFSGEPQKLKLPLAPAHPIIYNDAADQPQTRYHRDAGRGMAITVGRLRPDPIFDWRFVGLSHNMIRGAAGGSILTAELLKAKGLLGGE